MKVRIVLSLALGLAAVLPASALERQVWTGRYALPPGGRVAVENIQGDIQVEGWDRSEVEVSVVKTGLVPGSRLDDVRVALESGNRTLAFHTVYLARSGEPVRVDYRLHVPREVRLAPLRTVEGKITVRDVEGYVDARTLNGSIEEAGVTGPVVARAITGNIAVSLRALQGDQAPVRLDTVSGNIDLLLPAKANANLELQTVAGRIIGNYVFEVSAYPEDSTRRARAGRGGAPVYLRTVRGNIRVAEREELY